MSLTNVYTHVSATTVKMQSGPITRKFPQASV